MAIFSDLESMKELYDLIDKFDKSTLFNLELSIPIPQPQQIKIKMMKLSQDHPMGPDFTVTVGDSDGSEEIFEYKKNSPQSQSDSNAGKTVTAPLVGTFYASPSPDSEPYVQAGDKINKGDVLCIIEAMKTMNEIESELDGEIAEILVQNGSPVEYGQPLFRVK